MTAGIYIEIQGEDCYRDDLWSIRDYVQSFYPGIYVDVLYSGLHDFGIPEPTIIQDVEPGEDGWIDPSEVHDMVRDYIREMEK
jgi:hypothetical protein